MLERNFRTIGYLEGLSFLALLFIAMPMKYIAGNPIGVKWMGWIHGFLFLLYVVSGAITADARDWNSKKRILAFVAAIVPFGPFLFDRKS